MVCRRQGDDAVLVFPHGNLQMILSPKVQCKLIPKLGLGSVPCLSPVCMVVFEKQPENMETLKYGQSGRGWNVLPLSGCLPPNQAVMSAVWRCSCQVENALPVYHHLPLYSLLLWPFGVSTSYSQMCLVTLPYSPAILLFKHRSNRSYGSTRDLASFSIYCSWSGQS